MSATAIQAIVGVADAPIVLDEFGATLLKSQEPYVFQTRGYQGYRDDDELRLCVGVHDVCGGWVDRKPVSKTHDAIVCRSCYLRVVIPKLDTIRTYGELRQYLAHLQPAA